MTVTGLNNDYYLVNNPIIVAVDNQAVHHYVVRAVSLSAPFTEFTIRLYPSDTRVEFDLSEMVKGIMPIGKAVITGTQLDPVNNLRNIQITFTAYDESETIEMGKVILTRSFIRGGEFNGANISLSEGQSLRDSDAIRVWNGFPIAYSKVQGNQIVTTYLPGEFPVYTRIPSCNSVYLAFRNTYGSYQYWLFDGFNIEVSSRKPELLRNIRGEFQSLGADNDYTLTVSGRVDRKYFRMMRALAQSPEVYIYGLLDKMGEPNPGNIYWTRVHNNGNKFKSESHIDIKDVAFTFEIPTSENPSELW